jgi:hypothetical protein
MVSMAVVAGTALLIFGPSTVVAERRRGLERAAERAEPLVSAIERFEREKGVAPDSLAQLVPQYLSALPPHPIRACRTVRYWRLDTTKRRDLPRWMLSMDCPRFLDLDRFYFQPDMAYPTGPYDYHVGRWAYHVD